MSYGNVEGLQGDHTIYNQAFPTHAAPLRYPQPSLNIHNIQNPTMMLQEPAPHSAPVGLQQHPFDQPHPYMFQQGHSGTHASLPSHQAFSGNWYAQPPNYGTLEEEPDGYGDRQQRPG